MEPSDETNRPLPRGPEQDGLNIESSSSSAEVASPPPKELQGPAPQLRGLRSVVRSADRATANGVLAVAEFISRVCGPTAWGWVYVAAQRSLITTLMGVLTGLALFALPQTTEVLHGIREWLFQSPTADIQPPVTGAGLTALLALLLAALALALACWFSARVLVSSDERDVLPLFFAVDRRDDRGEQAGLKAFNQLKLARSWYPRIVGTVALSMVVLAFTLAARKPLASWYLPVALLVIPFAFLFAMMAFNFLQVRYGTKPDNRRHRLLILAAALSFFAMFAAYLGCLFFYDSAFDRFSTALTCWFINLLPAFFLEVLWVRHNQNAEAQVKAQKRSIDESVQMLQWWAFASVLAAFAVWWLGAQVTQAIGSAALLLIFFTALTLGLSFFELLGRRVAFNVPGVPLVLTILTWVAIGSVWQEGIGKEQVPMPAKASVVEQNYPLEQLDAAATRVAIHSYGGGLRAALFTARVLAGADDATCGRFAQHLSAMSGVSGGSVGIATYMALRQEFIGRWQQRIRSNQAQEATGPWENCVNGQDATRPLSKLVVKTLARDHLSAVLAQTLTVDLVRLWGSASRGQALLDSFQAAGVEALREGMEPTTEFALYATPMGKLTGGINPPPAVFFNATDADSGALAWSTTVAYDGGKLDEDDIGLGNSDVGTAMLNSARFPIVSPPGETTGRTKRLFVDGGYFDNSGATTLNNRSARLFPNRDLLRVFAVDGNPAEQRAHELCPEFAKSTKSGMVTGLRAFFAARSAHADIAERSLMSWVNEGASRAGQDAQASQLVTNPRFDRISLNFERGVKQCNAADADYEICEKGRKAACETAQGARRAPLGWYLGADSSAGMLDSVEEGIQKLVAQVQSEQVKAPELFDETGAKVQASQRPGKAALPKVPAEPVAPPAL